MGVTTVNTVHPGVRALGDSTCGPNGGLRGCARSTLSGCPAISGEVPCGPGFTCCPTCGLGGVPGIADCAPNPGCAAVPDACRTPGTFCLDDNTVATCTLAPPTASTPLPCLTVTDATPCAANQKCGPSPSGQCQ